MQHPRNPIIPTPARGGDYTSVRDTLAATRDTLAATYEAARSTYGTYAAAQPRPSEN